MCIVCGHFSGYGSPVTLVDLSSDEEGRNKSLTTAIMTERMEIHSAGGVGGGGVGGMVAMSPHRLDKRLPTPLVPRDSDHHVTDVDTLQATATNALVSVPVTPLTPGSPGGAIIPSRQLTSRQSTGSRGGTASGSRGGSRKSTVYAVTVLDNMKRISANATDILILRAVAEGSVVVPALSQPVHQPTPQPSPKNNNEIDLHFY